MLHIQHLTIHHLKDLRELISNLTITIHAGEKVAIIGEEGNGKSTLLKFLLNPDLVAGYTSYTGTISRRFSSPAYLPQSFPNELAQLSLYDYFFSIDEEIDYASLYRLADQLHFDSERFASPQIIADLSGGEKLKIQLLKLLASPHDILFFDEPSNDLDLETITWLKQFIRQSRETIVYISHDEDFLEQTADTIIHLELLQKRRLARTNVEHLDYLHYRKERERSFQLQAQRAKNEAKEHAKTMETYRRIKQNVESTLRNTHDATAGRLAAKKMKAVLSQGKRFEKTAKELTQRPDQEESIHLTFNSITPQPASKRLLELEKFDLLVDDKLLSQGIDFSLFGQDKIGIIGANGAGKSSFLKEIWRQLQKQGQIRLAYMPQDYGQILPQDATPIDFLNQSGQQSELEQIKSHLYQLNFSREEMVHPISNLSGGQQAKLLFLHTVLTNPQLLLLDEPTRNISPTSQPEIRALFAGFPGAIVTVSHDVRYLKAVCQKVYRLAADGLTEVRMEEL